MNYLHVDVFSAAPYGGNSLAVFPDARGLTAGQMAAITKELRHFESIFLFPGGEAGRFAARVFDLEGELDFAGHPVIGAAGVLHSLETEEETAGWTLELPARTVTVQTARTGPGAYEAVLDQGAPEFLGAPDAAMGGEIASWFGLAADDLDAGLRPEVVSTGLRYLVVPVRGGALERASVAVRHLEGKLAGLGAEFAYLLDADGMEGRHWNNDGLIEDVATGSGAGCVAAYLHRHGRLAAGELVGLAQGRFLGRPSRISLRVRAQDGRPVAVEVGGGVALVGFGRLERLPPAG